MAFMTRKEIEHEFQSVWSKYNAGYISWDTLVEKVNTCADQMEDYDASRAASMRESV